MKNGKITRIKKTEKEFILEPLFDNIVVQIPGEELEEVEGIMLKEDRELRRPVKCVGYITAMGDGRVLKDGTLVKISEKLKVGTIVYLNPSSGIKMNIPKNIEEPYDIIVKESDIIGILEERISTTEKEEVDK